MGVEGGDDTPDSVVTNNATKSHGGRHISEFSIGSSHTKSINCCQPSSIGACLLQTVIEVVWFLNYSSSGCCSSFRCSGSYNNDGWVCWPGCDTLVQDNGATYNIVSHVQEVVVLGTLHREKQLGHIVAVQGGGLCWQARWKVSVPDVCNIVVHGQLSRSNSFNIPPASAAKSTTTLPGFISSTMYFLIKMGAVLPGIRAVVMTISTSLHWSWSSFISASINSFDISLA